MGNTFMDYPTVESRRLFRYRVTAAATERFRMGSDIGGIMHFCSLTNCGTTGDDWLPDITTPEFPAEFIQYMPDAFSPLMVSINTGFTPRAPGSGESIEVVLVNDSYQPWTGPVRLAVQEKGLLLSEQSQTASVAALSKTAVNFTVTYPAYGPVRICRLEASLGLNGTRVRSVRDFALGAAKPVMPEDICDCGPDSTPPGAVSNVRVTGTASQAVSLAWDPASDPESQIAQYDVYRNDSLYAFVPGTVFVDTDVTERSSYAYQVAAVNQGCREGARSAVVNAVTPDDTIPPSIVSAVSVWNTGIIVRFNEAVEQGSAETMTNYALSDNASVVSAGLDPDDPAQVFLGTSAMTSGVSYVLTVSDILDRAISPNQVPAGSQAGFTVSCPQVNWAAGKPVTATSSAAQNPAIYAVDGDINTRWSSEFSDSQSLTVDLGAPPVYIEKVIIHWERAYAQEYFLQVDDGTGWTDVRHETSCQGGADTTVVNQMARWIRMDGIKRATAWGYSIWEFEVFPSCAGASPVRQAWRTESTLPGSFELSCAGPNPMAQSGPVIYYGLPVDSKVLLRVYDISGRLVKTLVNGSEKGGYHTVLFDGQADGRGALSNGVYFCHMRAGGSEKVIGFQLIR
jgi:chitodextrinase